MLLIPFIYENSKSDKIIILSKLNIYLSDYYVNKNGDSIFINIIFLLK